ncbi:MAG: tetratricopeptide repeat protein [Spirochaetes bacterium]|nr:tetratricopeptide repeat protein [Spirochaetota bacterium]
MSLKKVSLIILLSIFFAGSCDRYPQIIISRKIFSDASGESGKSVKKNQIDEIIKRYKLIKLDEKSYNAPPSKINRINYNRYFTDVFSFSPLADINNKGVEFALKGMYAEAEILLNEALKEDEKCPFIYNNLGVVHELNNNKEKAFNMYSKACILEPDNKYYRWNFLYFCDNKTTPVL